MAYGRWTRDGRRGLRTRGLSNQLRAIGLWTGSGGHRDLEFGHWNVVCGTTSRDGAVRLRQRGARHRGLPGRRRLHHAGVHGHDRLGRDLSQRDFVLGIGWSLVLAARQRDDGGRHRW